VPCTRTQQAKLLAYLHTNPFLNAERQAGKLSMPALKIFWSDSTRELSPSLPNTRWTLSPLNIKILSSFAKKKLMKKRFLENQPIPDFWWIILFFHTATDPTPFGHTSSDAWFLVSHLRATLATFLALKWRIWK